MVIKITKLSTIFLFRYSHPIHQGNGYKVKIFVDDIEIGEGEGKRDKGTKSLPTMVSANLATFPTKVKVQFIKRTYGYGLLSPIEFNVGKRFQCSNFSNKDYYILK